MIISICSVLFDYDGNYLLEADQDSDFSFVSRRVSRSATLDGGCVIVDNGYSASDASFSINLSRIDAAARLGILAMAQRHSLISVAVDGNVFSGAIERIDDAGKLKIKFLVKQRLNEA